MQGSMEYWLLSNVEMQGNMEDWLSNVEMQRNMVK
jgi:hypothetical protein